MYIGMGYASVPSKPDYGEPLAMTDPMSGRSVRAHAHPNSYDHSPPLVRQLEQYEDIVEDAPQSAVKTGVQSPLGGRTATLWGRPSIAVVVAHDQHDYEDLPVTHDFGFNSSNQTVIWQSKGRTPATTQDPSAELYDDDDDVYFDPDNSPPTPSDAPEVKVLEQPEYAEVPEDCV